MPDEFMKSIEEFNNRVNEIWIKNLKMQSSQLKRQLDLTLPLSNFDFSSKNDINNNETGVFEEENQCLENLVFDTRLEENSLVSNFAALSGLNDTHENFKIKDKSILIHLKSKYLSFKDLYPTIEVEQNVTDYYGNPIKFNSFFLDFYNHGIYASIINENKLREDLAYEYLRDFRAILENIAKISGENGTFLNEINEIHSKYAKLFHEEKKFNVKAY